MKGSMTIEASYLFPFCFLVFGIVCILGIYTYNVSVLQMTGYECILQTMEERNIEKGIVRDNLLRRAKQAGKDRTVGLEELEVSVKMTVSKISINYSGTHSIIKIPLEVTAVYQRSYPEVSLRLARGFNKNNE